MLFKKTTKLYYLPLLIWCIIYFLPFDKHIGNPDEKSLEFIERNLLGNVCFEYIDSLNNMFFTFTSGVLYLFHYVSPLTHLYILQKYGMKKVTKKYIKMLGYGNMISMILHIFSPTAPPWVIENKYFNKHWSPEAGLEKFDKLFGIRLFHSIYKHNQMLYASLPSLHVLWITNMLFIMFNRYTIIHTILIWFSTVYLHHHFWLDGIMSLIISAGCFICIR